MTDFGEQRKNMVASQVCPSDITDRRIIRAMEAVPRELFASGALRTTAYMDADLVVVAGGDGVSRRAMMAPRVFAKLIQLARIDDDDIVLDVGCMNGYSTAVVAKLAQTVVALEEDAVLGTKAGELLTELSVDNAVVETGALNVGMPGEGPFDAIILEGAVAQVPVALLDQLKDGGRLVAILSKAGIGSAVLWKRIGERFDSRPAFDAAAPVLPGFEAAVEFSL